MTKLKSLSLVLRSISNNKILDCNYQEAKIARNLERVIYRAYILVDEESEEIKNLGLNLSNPNNMDLKEFTNIWIDNITKLISSDNVDDDAKQYLNKCKKDLLAL